MGYSTEDVRGIKGRIDAALYGGHLNAWQRKFLTDIRAKFERYGAKTSLSDKQITKLYEIIERGPGQATSRRPYIAARSRQRRHGGVVEREVRWFARRMMHSIAFLAVIVAAGAVYSFFQEHPVSLTGGQSSAKPIASHQFTVTDGDTIRVRGDAKGTRLVGFNAPENRPHGRAPAEHREDLNALLKG